MIFRHLQFQRGQVERKTTLNNLDKLLESFPYRSTFVNNWVQRYEICSVFRTFTPRLNIFNMIDFIVSYEQRRSTSKQQDIYCHRPEVVLCFRGVCGQGA